MKRLLLDTSAYSAYLRGHDAVAREMRRADELVFCPIVIGELLAGFRKGNRFEHNFETLRQFLASPRARRVSLDDETADRYAVIHEALRKAGTPVPANDAWIAATAMQHGLRVLTTDAHYQRIAQITVLLHPPLPH